MAQILKDNVRQQILDAAVDELYVHGYKDSSMRRIALKAKTTAGNLYRYFENKDELINIITQPVMNRINEIIQKNTNQSIRINDNNFDISSLSFDAILSALDDLSYELVKIYYEQPKILIIMMKNNLVYEKILDWLTNLITQFMEFKNYINENNKKGCELLSRSFAVSLFAGVQECLTRNELEKDELSKVIKVYFRSCITMLDKNFESLEG